MGIWQEGEVGEPAGRAQPWDGGQEYPSLPLRGTSEAVRSFCKLRTSGLPRQPLSGVGFAQAPCVTLIQMLQGQCFEKLPRTSDKSRAGSHLRESGLQGK